MARRETDVPRLLAHLPLLQGLTDAELGRIAAGTTRKALRRGEVLFAQGERPTGFYLIVFGRIALTAKPRHGRERVVDILEGSRSFGEAIMFLDKPCIVTARAMEDTVVLRVGRETVLAELQRNPAFARRIIAALSAKLEATVRELETYAVASGARRFAAWLLRSVPSARMTASITLPAAKRAIASKLHLSAEHLSRILRELSQDGLIEAHGRQIHIPDTTRLRAWADAEPAAKPRGLRKP